MDESYRGILDVNIPEELLDVFPLIELQDTFFMFLGSLDKLSLLFT